MAAAGGQCNGASDRAGRGPGSGLLLQLDFLCVPCGAACWATLSPGSTRARPRPSSGSRPLGPRCMPVCSKEAAGRLRVTERHLQHLPRRLWSQAAWQPRVAPEGPASCCGCLWGLSPASDGPRRPPRIQGDGPATGASSEQGDFQVGGPSPFGIQATALGGGWRWCLEARRGAERTSKAMGSLSYNSNSRSLPPLCSEKKLKVLLGEGALQQTWLGRSSAIM